MPVMDVEAALARRSSVVDFTRRLLVRGQDFGDAAASGKPALLKPGAEKLCNYFGLEPSFTLLAEEIDWTGTKHAGEMFFYARYRCDLLRDGHTIGTGEGSANSWESRYRYRWQEPGSATACAEHSVLPVRRSVQTYCEFEFAVDRGEISGPYGKPADYWRRFRDAIAAGTARHVERDSRHGTLPAWEIDVEATLIRIQNPEIADVVNTIQKMAQKRALVAATLIATSTSEFFTQDIEDREFNQSESFSVGETIERTGKTSGADRPEKLPVTSDHPECIAKPWKKFGEMRQFFEGIREKVGETRYFEELALAGVANPGEFRSASKALECYSRLVRIAAQTEAA